MNSASYRPPMMVAEEFYNTSLDCCNYLVETMISAEQLDQVRHKAHISDAVHRAGQCRHLTEADAYERRSRGKPAVKRRYRKALHGTGLFLTAIPSRMNGTILSPQEWRDNVRILYNLEPLDMPQYCDGCGAKMTVEHACACKCGGLVHIRHDDLGGEYRQLASCALSHSRVERKPYIHSSTGRCEREIAAEEANGQPPAAQPQQQPAQQQQQ